MKPPSVSWGSTPRWSELSPSSCSPAWSSTIRKSFITSRRKRKRSPPGSKAPRWSTKRTLPTTKTRQAYRALVRDHFAILKVGPALTFALREAIFALAQMENELIAPESRSRVMEVIDEVMLNEPGYWKKYYRPTWSQAMVDIHFSLSDRIRYYWPHPRIRQSVEKLIANLTDAKLPLGLISQYMPVQFERLSLNELNAEPHALILDKIQDVLRAYRYGCSSETA
ncbi:Tagatose-6-phosphate kinase GatZ [Klebsiella pneumoniae]|nr:Tagatose-6-phosphate kinase GatZ [Klebsiella pneumoniae]